MAFRVCRRVSLKCKWEISGNRLFNGRNEKLGISELKRPNRQAFDTDTAASPERCTTLFRFSDTTKRLSLNFGDPDSPLTRLLELLSKPALRCIRFEEFQEIYHRVASDPRSEDFIFHKILDSLGIKLVHNREKLAQVPREGPLLVVGNHPLALVDGFAIMSVMKTHRRDVKGLAITGLSRIPEMREHLIRVKLGNSTRAKRRNRQAITEAIKWLKAGHALLTFPAGDISVRRPLWKKVADDSEWAKGLGLLVRRSKADVLPVFFHGQTSLLFQLARSSHKFLGKLLFFRELLLAKNVPIRFVLGDIVNHEVLTKIGNSQDVVDYLRKATYSLEGVPFETDKE